MKYAKEKGVEVYDFGGIRAPSPFPEKAPTVEELKKLFPRSAFKFSFGAVPKIQYSYSKAYSIPATLASRIESWIDSPKSSKRNPVPLVREN
jgi:hypothetical protein